MDLKDRFDLATSGGPTHATLDTRIQHGRRAARRRAASRALGAAVVAATVMGGVATLSTGQEDRATERPAPADASRTPTPSPALDIPVTASMDNWEPDEWARMNPRTAELTLRRGVTATDKVDPAIPGVVSVALDLTRDGEQRYVLLVRRQGIVSVGGEAPAGRTLREFIADRRDPIDELPIATKRGTLDASLPLIGYDDGELYTVGGAEIVRVIEDPIEGFCAPNATAAVELLHKGVTYFAVLADGNCGSSFSKYGDSLSLEATVARRRANIDWAGDEQGERERLALERAIAEREQSDRQ